MRLTKTDKQAFIDAVMNDVPFVDYDEETRSLLRKWGVESLPEDLHPMAKKYPSYFETFYIYTPCPLPSVHVLCNPDWQGSGFKNKEPEKYAQLVEMSKSARAQSETLEALRRKITGLIESCSTLKTARERLPEFEKYLPADRDGGGTINLPVSNVLAELTNLGWPKGVPYAASA